MFTSRLKITSEAFIHTYNDLPEVITRRRSGQASLRSSGFHCAQALRVWSYKDNAYWRVEKQLLDKKFLFTLFAKSHKLPSFAWRQTSRSFLSHLWCMLSYFVFDDNSIVVSLTNIIISDQPWLFPYRFECCLAICELWTWKHTNSWKVVSTFVSRNRSPLVWQSRERL